MPDFVGSVEVPEVAASGVFPISFEREFTVVRDREIAVHAFESVNHKIEQRFILGQPGRRITVRRSKLRESDRTALRDFFAARRGRYEPFTLNLPTGDYSGTSAVTVRFADPRLSWRQVANFIATTGVDLIEQPSGTPSYTVTAERERFPDAGLDAALLGQVQELIPLVRLRVVEQGYPDVWLSDRRVTLTIGGTPRTYVPRVLSVDGIAQGIGGELDDATFTFANADGVMRALANATDLTNAVITYSLFHVATGVKLDFWTGRVERFEGEEGEEFRVYATDGLPLGLDYPRRKIDRQCGWEFNDGANCPYAANGTAGFLSCDKSFGNCTARGMANWFGGVPVSPQGVQIANKSFFGLQRQMINSFSLVNDSIYGAPLQEVYTDSAMPVDCLIASGREENDFYVALGVVGAGPIGGYDADNARHRLDGQPRHGPGALGLRRSFGDHPVANNAPDANSDKFSLGSGNPTVYGAERAAGVAFVEIRRTDPRGVQLSRAQDHTMQAWVTAGLGGWTWTAPGSRNWTAPLVNPIWIAVNMVLRALNVQKSTISNQELVFDVAAAIQAASICDAMAVKVIGAGTEPQFRFRGVVNQVRPLRDWLADVLTNCLGYYTFANGKIRFGIRSNSSAAQAFTQGNVVRDSLTLERFAPEYNELTARFQDEEFAYQQNTIRVEDEQHRKLYQRRSASIDLGGCATKSQAARVALVRLREELGGITAAEYRAARLIRFRTTALALSVEPGMVCSLTHPIWSGEFRVVRWRLNPDYSIDVEARSTADSMYDLTAGPKPSDVVASPVPGELIIDLVPGDVRPISAQAFTIVQPLPVEIASDNSQSVVFELTYDPPQPIGTFGGVRFWVRRLSDGKVFEIGDRDYNGDPNGVGAARYGTARYLVQPPGASSENWEVYLSSRSPVYDKPLVLNGASGTVTPFRAVTVAPVVPVGGAAPAENVASVTGTPIYAAERWGVQGAVTFGSNRASIARAELVIDGPYDLSNNVIAGVTRQQPWAEFVPPLSGSYNYTSDVSWLRAGGQQRYRVLCRVYNAADELTDSPPASSFFTVDPVNMTTQASSVGASVLTEYTVDGVEAWKLNVSWTQANDQDASHTMVYVEYQGSGGTYGPRGLYTQTAPGGGDNGFAQGHIGSILEAVPSSSRSIRVTFVTITRDGRERGSAPQFVLSVFPGVGNLQGARLQNSSVTDSKIASLSVGKLTAGTIAVSVTLTAPTIQVSSGSVVVNIDGSNYVRVQDTAITRVCRMTGTQFIVESTTVPSSVFSALSAGRLVMASFSGQIDLQPTSVALASGGIVSVAGSTVVGSRRTGWSTATGFANRSSFDTTSVTLAGLAERVKALIDDLHVGAGGHGLIG